jgi:hypothetical protein
MLFGSQTGEDLLDDSPLCSPATPGLVWADGTPSGYRIKTIHRDLMNHTVSFTVEITP